MTCELLDPQLIADAPVENLREMRVIGTGSFYEFLVQAGQHDELSGRIQEVLSELRGKPAEFEEFSKIAASELLLVNSYDSSLARSVAQTTGLSEIHPFARAANWRGPTLGELFDAKAAVAVIPLDPISERFAPLLMQVWMVRRLPAAFWKNDQDHHLLIDGWDAYAQDLGYSIFIVPFLALENSVSGSSWRLGADLARRVLDEQPQRIRELAVSWIVTGDLQGNEVTAVDVARKSALAVATAPRRWMVPLASREHDRLGKDFGELLMGRHIFVRDLATAWAAFTGYLTFELDLSPKPWPERVDAVHALVSNALTPIIATVLIRQPIREAVFWLSKEMQGHESRIRQVLDIAVSCGLLDRDFVEKKVRYPPVESSTRGAVERALNDSTAALGSHGDECILFNKTGGNDSLKSAVENFARLHTHVRLVYRDVDNKKTAVFHDIRYTARLSVSERLDAGAEWIEWLDHSIPWDRPDEVIEFAKETLPVIARHIRPL